MIDWSRVRQLNTEVGAEDFDEVVELFLEEVEEALARLAALTDRSSLSADMHFLKGSALSLGFETLARLCGEGETAAEANKGDAVDLAAIKACYTKSKEAFLADYSAKLAA